MIDFSLLPRRNKTYAGANGSKIAVMYEDELYMLKFPGIARKNKDMSYANGCICEYLGCHIFEIAGIPVQKTLLGTFTRNGKEKIVVACKDFTTPDTVIQDFASLKNTIIDSEHNGYGTELSDILMAMDEQQAIDPDALRQRFWDMFIVDALIGNWDRHNGNWGFLYNSRTDEMTLAPVFDCGSSLFPQADDDIMQAVLD
ncbi:MAG: HipA domain-containing protein, partial [Clostridia bacterium]|nr:HipA domain-containing protein [Clostridia bacterium]